MARTCNGWSYASNHHSDANGRVIVIWKAHAAVRVFNQTRQSLTCEITISSDLRFYYTTIYAANTNEERYDLWVELLNLQQALSLDVCPWILGGDFNQIIHYAEHSSPRVNYITPPMASLKNALTQLGVFDLRFLGPFHTWSNKSPSSPIAEKLDRLLVNQPWIANYPNSLASFLPPNFSDHIPCLLDLSFPLPSAGIRPFNFFYFLTKHHRFLQTLEEAWIQARGYALDLSALCFKLRKVKQALKTLNREKFSNIQERVRESNLLLQSVQVQALQNPTPEIFREEQTQHEKWCFLRLIEEAFSNRNLVSIGLKKETSIPHSST